MTPYERISALLAGQSTDCLPCMPITMMFAADVGGVPYGEYATDFRKLVACQLKTAREYQFDYVSAISDPSREAADLGTDVRFFPDAPPAINESNALLTDMNRLDSLTPICPQDKPEGRMFDRVKAVAEFARQVKGEYFIEGWVEGPCAEAADLRGINRLMLDFMMEPDFIRKLFAFTCDQALLFAQAQIEAGADIIGVGDAAASLVGPKLYKKFVLEEEKRLIDGIHERGGRVRLHICGNINKILPSIAQLQADMVDLDSPVPVAAARNALGDGQVLTGNIDPVRVLRNGTRDDIRRELSKCFAESEGNYIVAAGCEVPRDTPLENVRTLVDFAKTAFCV